MAPTRCICAVLFATLACAAQAQTSQYAPSRPSVPSGPSTPTVEFDEAGNPKNPGMNPNTPTPGAVAPASAHAPARDTTQMLGAGSFGQSAGLENVLNSGTPPSWDRKAGVRKVCPPGLENRNNVCSPPMGSVLSQ